jgi:drug/metabolite transporter (DMT)-like permease
VVQSRVPFAVIATCAFGQERLHFRRLTGIAFALAGVAVIVGLPDVNNGSLGPVLIILGSASWGAVQGVISFVPIRASRAAS